MKKKPPNFIIVLSLPSACEKSVSDIGQNTEISDSEHNDDKFDFFPLAWCPKILISLCNGMSFNIMLDAVLLARYF